MTIWLWAIFTAILVALPIAWRPRPARPRTGRCLPPTTPFWPATRPSSPDMRKIRGHTLDSYVTFWRLRLRLE